MRYQFEPLDKPPMERLLDTVATLERAGDLVAAILMPVYLALVALVTWYDGFSVVSAIVVLTVAVNCWPAARGLRAIRTARATA
jgi:hypothetical protein